MNYFDATNRDGHIYCQNCYEANFGVKGHATSHADLKKPIHGDLAQMYQLLADPKFNTNDVHATDSEKNTGFHVACFKGNTNVVKILLSKSGERKIFNFKIDRSLL